MADVRVMEMSLSIVALIVSVAALVNTWRSSKRTHATSIMPALVFSRKSEGIWQLQNVGNGPALDVLIGECENETWPRVTRCYPVAAGTMIGVPWLLCSGKLAATYTDTDGEYHTCECIEGRTQLTLGNLFESWQPNQEEWQLREQDEAKKAFG